MSAVFKARTISTLILWAILFATMSSGLGIAYILVVGTTTSLAYWEYQQLHLRKEHILGWKTGLFINIAYPVCLGVIFSQGFGNDGVGWGDGVGGLEMPRDFDLGFLIFALGCFFCQRMKSGFKADKAYGVVSANIMSLFYLTFLFSFIIKILFLFPGREGTQTPGVYYMFWFILVTKFGDMGALFAGTLFGKDKMIPSISPGKTWQGFMGALAFSVLAGVVDYALFKDQFTLFHGYIEVILLALVLSIAGILGDLAESLLKRSLKTKDSSMVIPGIGGVLDLIDSICFTAPIMYFYSKYFLIP